MTNHHEIIDFLFLDVDLLDSTKNCILNLWPKVINNGFIFTGSPDGSYRYLNQKKSGLDVLGDVRQIIVDGKRLLFAINNADVLAYEIENLIP